MADKASPEFYRQEAERLVRLASTISESTVRIKLLEVAAGYQQLANRASDAQQLGDKFKRKSATAGS